MSQEDSSLDSPENKRVKRGYTVTIVEATEANAVLFIMATWKSHKFMLHISYYDEPITSTKIINTDLLLKELPDEIYAIMPESEWCKNGLAGLIQKIKSNATLQVLIYVFGNTTRCSNACEATFGGVDEVQDGRKIQYGQGINRNVAWSFYSLNPKADDPLNKYFDGKNNRCLREELVLRVPKDEYERMTCLQFSIQHHYSVNVQTVNAMTRTDHHCQFSGGGDLLITIEDSLSTLVITEGSSEEEKDFSPVHKGASKSTTLSIVPHENLKYQLCANIFMASVTSLVQKLSSFTDTDLINLSSIEGYGIAYTGIADVGCFKVVIRFGKCTKIITELKLERRTPNLAASIVDSLLDYVIGKMKYIKTK